MLQGPTFSFIPPMLAMINMDEYKCPSDVAFLNTTSDEAFGSRMQIVYKANICLEYSLMFFGLR